MRTKSRAEALSEPKIGDPAPEFALPDLRGQVRAISEFRGRPVLLLFQDPGCAPCQELVPVLTERYRQGSFSGEIIMVSRGGAAKNLAKKRQYNIPFPILLQERWEVSRKYAAFAVPMAYSLDEAGRVSGGPLLGLEAILAMWSDGV